MKIQIIYDTKYGKNKRIALYVADKLKTTHEVNINSTKEMKPKAVISYRPDMVIFGGPRHFGKWCHTIRKWIKKYAQLQTTTGYSPVKIAAWETFSHDPKIEDQIKQKENEEDRKLWQQISEPFREATRDSIPELLQIRVENEISLGAGDLQTDWEEIVNSFIQRLNL